MKWSSYQRRKGDAMYSYELVDVLQRGELIKHAMSYKTMPNGRDDLIDVIKNVSIPLPILMVNRGCLPYDYYWVAGGSTEPSEMLLFPVITQCGEFVDVRYNIRPAELLSFLVEDNLPTAYVVFSETIEGNDTVIKAIVDYKMYYILRNAQCHPDKRYDYISAENARYLINDGKAVYLRSDEASPCLDGKHLMINPFADVYPITYHDLLAAKHDYLSIELARERMAKFHSSDPYELVFP
jgi:hypothetical protein